jgi:hypothetical protein
MRGRGCHWCLHLQTTVHFGQFASPGIAPVGNSAMCGGCQSFCDQPAASTDLGDQFTRLATGKVYQLAIWAGLAERKRYNLACFECQLGRLRCWCPAPAPAVPRWCRRERGCARADGCPAAQLAAHQPSACRMPCRHKNTADLHRPNLDRVSRAAGGSPLANGTALTRLLGGVRAGRSILPPT